MINVALCRKTNGAFTECSVKGHALFAAKGTDIVCAAVTAIVRTAAEVLCSADDGSAAVSITASVRGQLVFRVTEKCSVSTELLTYTADFIQKGIERIAEEYPQCVCIRVKIVK